MSMTVVVVRDVPSRFRGFLASCMLEIAPGVYTSPQLNPAVRERIWKVLSEWYRYQRRGGIVMTWAEPASPCGQDVAFLGDPPKYLVVKDAMILAHRTYTADPGG